MASSKSQQVRKVFTSLMQKCHNMVNPKIAIVFPSLQSLMAKASHVAHKDSGGEGSSSASFCNEGNTLPAQVIYYIFAGIS